LQASLLILNVFCVFVFKETILLLFVYFFEIMCQIYCDHYFTVPLPILRETCKRAEDLQYILDRAKIEESFDAIAGAANPIDIIEHFAGVCALLCVAMNENVLQL